MNNEVAREDRMLMLVSGFPPARQAILRAVKFAKYLPEYGWMPVVLTPSEQPRRRGESDRVAPEGILVTRTPRIPPVSALASSMSKRIRIWRGKIESASDVAPSARDDVRSRFSTTVRQALLWADTPDAFAGWIPFAVVRGWSLARKCRARVIYASGPPFSVVCAGALLSALVRLPLVVDFRDAWTLDPLNPIGTLTGSFTAAVSPGRVRLLKTLEQWVLARCAAVLFTSTLTRARYLAEYPAIEAKSYLIYNGVDLDDFVGELKPGTQPTIAHVGTLHDFQWNQVQRFLDGFALALRSEVVPRSAQVVFVGAIGLALRARLEKAISQLGIEESVRIIGFVSHTQAVHWMRSSRLLLLFAGEGPHYFRLSKISEYVVAGAPMLAFAPHESQTAEEIRVYGGRVLADASDRDVGVELALAFSTNADSHRRLQAIEHPHPLNRRTEAQSLAEICFKVAEL